MVFQVLIVKGEIVSAGMPAAVLVRCVPAIVVLLVVCPHAQHPHHPLLREHFIDQTMLDIYASRIGARQIADEFFVGWRVLEWIGG